MAAWTHPTLVDQHFARGEHPDREAYVAPYVPDLVVVDDGHEHRGVPRVAALAIGAEGPAQEVYLVGPRDDPDPRTWRTELAWPVLRTV